MFSPDFCLISCWYTKEWVFFNLFFELWTTMVIKVMKKFIFLCKPLCMWQYPLLDLSELPLHYT